MFWRDEERKEIADLTLSEARETLNRQLEAQSDIDTKAARVLRINTILLGIVISGVSFLLDDSILRDGGQVFNGFTVAGLVLLLGSTAFAALTYSASDSVVGISQEDIETLIDGEYSAIANREGLALSFGEWIEFNSETIDIDAFYFTSTTTLLIWSLSFLSLGIADAISHPIRYPSLSLVAGTLLVFTYTTEWTTQFTAWLRLVEPFMRLKAYVLGGITLSR